jgi:hypothetical protein
MLLEPLNTSPHVADCQLQNLTRSTDFQADIPIQTDTISVEISSDFVKYRHESLFTGDRQPFRFSTIQ